MTTATNAAARRPAMLRIAIWLAAAAIVLLAGRRLAAEGALSAALAWVSGLGPWGPAAFIAIYVLATVAFLPGSILTLGAGAVFGVVMGSVYVSAASTLGATAAFLIGRHFARDAVARRTAGHPGFAAVDKAVAAEGWKIVGLIRLSPLFPFNLLNYALGVTQVGLRDYVLASWVGMMPGTIMYVYVGSLAGDVAGLGAAGRTRTPAEWALYIVGLLATVAVSLYVTRIARKALERRMGAEPGGMHA